MVTFNCLSALVVGKKNKSKKTNKNLDVKKGEANVKPRVKPIDLPYQSEENNASKEEISSPLSPKPKPTSNENMITRVDSGGADAAYEGGDEHDEVLSMKRDYSDLDLHAQANSMDSNPEFVQLRHELIETKSERDEPITPDLLMQSGHVSDPGISRPTAFCGSPSLKRSCSNIETKRTNLQNFDSPTKSQSYTDLKNLSTGGNSLYRIQSSPLSAKSNCSADRVMLKKRSSSQVLPSRSRKVWWKLFLWSHRNLHKPSDFSKPPIPSLTFHQKAGYSSDTLEPSQTPLKGKNKAVKESGNQWVAFAMDSSSPLDRINAWVNSIDETELAPIHDSDDGEIEEQKKGDFEIGESSGKNRSSYAGRRTSEEIMQANNVIQSLSSFSSVAHISGMGLKVIPSISTFSSLRTINLSGNFIGQINPGSLPKSLHTLDLSRNKIATIEGLRELTRLRVLNLSYNKISRIGHGLSNCILIKELYLAGNKISNVEGLHRLLKLTVLDLSFNKLTTSKALGQLVANYNSLLALNLIGNPIQANIGDDQLRKAVTSLLPHLTYLNKQPIKP
ncbi:uncharacterized protein A4U43_C03F18260 [Asparagus officinalis]|uniref:Uncharacterized protein n=2 Tax=Asparagus officinalis TaxID=4686 RepID=A0A5P1FB31_ASPOF|nr:uncharacterized protein A4U43_C03F18260 [Asparagus officinalis]